MRAAYQITEINGMHMVQSQKHENMRAQESSKAHTWVFSGKRTRHKLEGAPHSISTHQTSR